MTKVKSMWHSPRADVEAAIRKEAKRMVVLVRRNGRIIKRIERSQ